MQPRNPHPTSTPAPPPAHALRSPGMLIMAALALVLLAWSTWFAGLHSLVLYAALAPAVWGLWRVWCRVLWRPPALSVGEDARRRRGPSPVAHALAYMVVTLAALFYSLPAAVDMVRGTRSVTTQDFDLTALDFIVTRRSLMTGRPGGDAWRVTTRHPRLEFVIPRWHTPPVECARSLRITYWPYTRRVRQVDSVPPPPSLPATATRPLPSYCWLRGS